MRNIIGFAVLIFFASLNIFSSCQKEKPFEVVELWMMIPLNIKPIKDTVSVGDTLTLEANFPDSLLEYNSGKYYKFENFNFRTRAIFHTFLSNSQSLFLSQQPGAGGAFTIVTDSAGLKNVTETFGDLTFSYSNGRYTTKSLIIPKHKGVFSIGFYSQYLGERTRINFIDAGPDSYGGRKRVTLRDFWYTINEGQTNVEILKQHSKLVSTTENRLVDNIQFEQKGTYTFVVK